MGIEHLVPRLSISKLNMWRATPRKFGRVYLKGEGESVPPMWRGTAVEHGLKLFLRGGNISDAELEAWSIYDQEAQGEISDEIEEQKKLIRPMLKRATEWEPPSPLNATQVEIGYQFSSVPIPIVGYLDFAFDGIDVDLKTTDKMPSYPRSDHVRQVALYRVARERRGGLLYVTASRHKFYEIDDDDKKAAMRSIESDAMSLFRMLSRATDPDDFIAMLPEFDRYEKSRKKAA